MADVTLIPVKGDISRIEREAGSDGVLDADDYYVVNNGNVYLCAYVSVALGAAVDLTVETFHSVDGIALPDKEYRVPQNTAVGSILSFGPFRPEVYNEGGNIHASVDADNAGFNLMAVQF